jgi:hypothetical protein
MECRDAQFYLRLTRHTADELGADVTGALDGHLALCPACAADARAAASFDRAIGTAMRAVPVPPGLREHLITRAAAQQGAILRRKLSRAAAACGAALVLLCLGLGVIWSSRPKLDTQQLVEAGDAHLGARQESVRNWLIEQKLPDRLPPPVPNDDRPFDFDLYLDHGLQRVQGRDVPFVLFRSPDGTGFAKVYILRDNGPFDNKGLQEAQGSFTRAQVMVGQGQFRGVTYVFVHTVHTGPDLRPFLRDGPQA